MKPDRTGYSKVYIKKKEFLSGQPQECVHILGDGKCQANVCIDNYYLLYIRALELN